MEAARRIREALREYNSEQIANTAMTDLLRSGVTSSLIEISRRLGTVGAESRGCKFLIVRVEKSNFE